MAADVDICNLALSYIGDTADVQSIAPPDGSVQAGFCSRFYPIAVKALLELGTWGFSTRRVALAALELNPSSTWLFAYAMPASAINAISILPSDAIDDYSENFADYAACDSPGSPTGYFPAFPPGANYPNPADNFYTPQPYSIETQADGTQIILTNVDSAVLRYTTTVADPNQFSPLFVMSLSYMLASMLAGPLIKGDSGAQKSAEMLAKSQAFLGQARASDANQRRTNLQQSVPWMAGR